VWAQAWYQPLTLTRGKTYTFTASGTFEGPSGPAFKVASLQYYAPTLATVTPVLTTVPDIVGLLESVALTRLTAANLMIGYVNNMTQQVATNLLLVIEQSPAANTRVPEGSAVNMTVTMTGSMTGVSAVQCFNRTTDSVAVEIWTWNGSQWQDRGSIAYNNTKPLTVNVSKGQVLTIAGYRPDQAPPNGTSRAQVTVVGGTGGTQSFTVD